jgi:hypothetical protein
MALLDLIRKRDTEAAIATFAISATGLNKRDGPVAGVAAVAVADEYRARIKNVAAMSMSEVQTLLEWLARIEETDQAVIDGVLRDCRHDVKTRAFFLNLATEDTV